jgi:hypothetical protein
MDERTTYVQQLQQDAGAVVLINQFSVAPDEVERSWTSGPTTPPS